MSDKVCGIGFVRIDPTSTTVAVARKLGVIESLIRDCKTPYPSGDPREFKVEHIWLVRFKKTKDPNRQMPKVLYKDGVLYITHAYLVELGKMVNYRTMPVELDRWNRHDMLFAFAFASSLVESVRQAMFDLNSRGEDVDARFFDPAFRLSIHQGVVDVVIEKSKPS